MPDTDSGDVRKSDRADGRTSGTMRTKISYYLPAVLVVLLAMGGYDILRKSVSYYFMNPYAQSGLPGHVEEMFMSFDQDLDGYIDMIEFGELHRQLKESDRDVTFGEVSSIHIQREAGLLGANNTVTTRAPWALR